MNSCLAFDVFRWVLLQGPPGPCAVRGAGYHFPAHERFPRQGRSRLMGSRIALDGHATWGSGGFRRRALAPRFGGRLDGRHLVKALEESAES
jgi:hypothetical protein